MSGATRPVRADEVSRLLPALRAAHVVATAEELAGLREAAPWGIRVADSGDAMMLARWRQHLDVLSIRAMIAPPSRVGPLLDDACAVARSQGLASMLSPVMPESAATHYLAAGFASVVELVVYAAPAGALHNRGMFAGFRPRLESLARTGPHAASVRPATSADVPALAAMDARCFEEFWRFGEPEMAEELSTARVVVARDGRGVIVGYSSAVLRGASVALGRLAVDPAARRSGIATALVADVDAWGKRAGALGVSLATQVDNQASRGLYRALGFDQLEERYVMLSRSA